MAKLELADDVVGPPCDGTNDEQAQNSGDETERVEDGRDGEHAQSDLSLQHQCNSPFPSDLPTLAQGIGMTERTKHTAR